MIRILRRTLILLPVILGTAAATVAPAYAGMSFPNHCEPLTGVSPTR